MLSPPPLLDDFVYQEWLREVRDLLSLTTTATLDFPNILAGLTADLTVTLRGVVATDNNTILLGPPSTIEAGLTWVGFVSANDTITIRIMASAATNPAPGLWRVSALKY